MMAPGIHENAILEKGLKKSKVIKLHFKTKEKFGYLRKIVPVQLNKFQIQTPKWSIIKKS